MYSQHVLTPGKEIRIRDISPDGKEFYADRKKAEKEFKDVRDELINLQNKFYADGRHKLLVVLQAMDAGGKDSTIRKVFKGVNPQGVAVASFKAPSKNELAHDFLWRIHQKVPPAGMIGVFNRSHYEDVLVVRVDQLVPEAVWRPRYQMINDFERLLTSTGTTILKFFLHISKDEQRQRFQDRLDDPEKHWKFDSADLEKRKKWETYQDAFEEMLNECTTEHAPWFVIPANQKWYRNLVITKAIVDTINKMGPEYPPEESGLEQLVVE
ncbi:MAG: polyphosphate kinase 2 family protein [Pirellulaceae bacterium]